MAFSRYLIGVRSDSSSRLGKISLIASHQARPLIRRGFVLRGIVSCSTNRLTEASRKGLRAEARLAINRGLMSISCSMCNSSNSCNFDKGLNMSQMFMEFCKHETRMVYKLLRTNKIQSTYPRVGQYIFLKCSQKFQETQFSKLQQLVNLFYLSLKMGDLKLQIRMRYFQLGIREFRDNAIDSKTTAWLQMSHFTD